VNYSNNATRAAGTGWDAIQEQIAKLEKRHAYHIAQYGEVSITCNCYVTCYVTVRARQCLSWCHNQLSVVSPCGRFCHGVDQFEASIYLPFWYRQRRSFVPLQRLLLLLLLRRFTNFPRRATSAA
jgi:hypothetical protein